MTFRRHSLLASLAIGICAAVLFVNPTNANAQTVCTSASTASDACKTTIDNVTAALGGAGVTDISSVDGTCADSTKFPPSRGVTGWTGQHCGMVARASGRTPYQHTPYQAGDTVNCIYINGISSYSSSVASDQEKCAITHQGVTQYIDSGAFQQVAVNTDPNGNSTVSSSNSVTSGIADAANSVLDGVAWGILKFANFLLGITGVLLNLAVFYGVFQFGNTIGNAPGVLIAWGILRDIANMALLFGFIFMGVATILDTSAVQGFTAKKALPSLIIFAVLMNFSLFTAEALIDVSNALSSSIYSQANTDACSGAGTLIVTSVNPGECGWNYGLAGHIMQSTGLSSIFATHDQQSLSLNATAFLGLALFATIGAIVFLSASIMLVIRLIILTFLMVVSPIGFAGMAIPPLQAVAGKWWNQLIHQAFYAPLFLLLVLISLKISDSFTSSAAHVNNGLLAAVSDPNASVIGIILIFTLVCGFLLASLMVANRFGAAGATGAVNFSRKMVLGSYGGIAGIAGRQTLGRGANWTQKKYQSIAANRPGLRSFLLNSGLDEVAMNITDKGKQAKFGSSRSFADIETRNKDRNKKLDGLKVIGDVKRASKAKEDGELREALKKLSDTEIVESDLLRSGDQLLKDIALNTSAERFDKLMNNDKLSDVTKGKMRTERYNDLNAAVQEMKDSAGDPTKKAQYDAAKLKVGQMANALSDKDFGQFAQSTHSGILEDTEFVGAFSDDNFKDKRKNSSLTSAQVETFDSTRLKILSDPAAVAERISIMSGRDITKNIKSDVLSSRAVLSRISGRKLALIDLDNIPNDDHVNAIVDYIKKNVLTDPARAADFRTQLSADPRIAKRWEARRII